MQLLNSYREKSENKVAKVNPKSEVSIDELSKVLVKGLRMLIDIIYEVVDEIIHSLE